MVMSQRNVMRKGPCCIKGRSEIRGMPLLSFSSTAIISIFLMICFSSSSFKAVSSFGFPSSFSSKHIHANAHLVHTRRRRRLKNRKVGSNCATNNCAGAVDGAVDGASASAGTISFTKISTRRKAFNERNQEEDTDFFVQSNNFTQQEQSSPSSPSSPKWPTKLQNTLTSNPKQSILFSISSAAAGAILGPFLDTYHSIFGVLQYDHPFTAQLWSYNDIPALVTTWWVPYLFGLAGFIIGWLYIIFDSVLAIDDDDGGINMTRTNINTNRNQRFSINTPNGYSPPIICLGISIFTFQYWLSGILSTYDVDRTIIFVIMSIYAYFGFVKLDNTKSGLITSLATAIGGPLIEVGLISFLTDSIGGYHYTDPGETGFFPLWIVPVYFLGGPANGNLARGVWDALEIYTKRMDPSIPKGCKVCNDTRAVPCPNCDGVGYYVTYGKEVKCNCCKGRGYVICRECFHLYKEDPNDIESIREMMSRLPD